MVGEHDNFAYYSNASNQEPIELKHGEVYGLSNSFLDIPWPKVLRGKALLNNYIDQLSTKSWQDIDVDNLFDILEDGVKPPANELPNTGIGEPWETSLSSIFVKTPLGYGTRSSTVYLLNEQNHATFIERAYNEDGTLAHSNRHEFDVHK